MKNHSKQIAETTWEPTETVVDIPEKLGRLLWELRRDGHIDDAHINMVVNEQEQALQTAERRGEERERGRIADLIDFDMEEVCLKTGCVNNKHDFLASIKPTSKGKI